MPNLKDIRRRIDSVKKTQQITSAMRMVAAAKLRRATDAILAARPYADRMQGTLAEVAASQSEAEHPLLEPRKQIHNVELVVMASDRGLCGAFNANIIKQAEAEREARGAQAEISLTVVGRKVADFYRRRMPDQITKRLTGISRVEYSHAAEVAHHVAHRFLEGEVDQVLLVHSEFVSAMTQRPRTVPILPAAPEIEEGKAQEKLPYDIEPNAEKLLRVLVPKAIEVQIFRALLENQAGEHAARMTAMESATRNTEELISNLTLQYNRARQAAITKELVEIVSGAEAL